MYISTLTLYVHINNLYLSTFHWKREKLLFIWFSFVVTFLIIYMYVKSTFKFANVELVILLYYFNFRIRLKVYITCMRVDSNGIRQSYTSGKTRRLRKCQYSYTNTFERKQECCTCDITFTIYF